MAQNGMGEIKAAEARLALAKKAEVRSTLTLKNAAAAFDAVVDLLDALIRDQNAYEAARNALDATRKILKEAEKEVNEARSDLKEAEDALKIANDKWELIEIDGDEVKEGDGGGKKRVVSPTDADEGGPNKKPRDTKKEIEGRIKSLRDELYKKTLEKLEAKENEVRHGHDEVSIPSPAIFYIRNVQSIVVEGCGTLTANGLYLRSNQISNGLPVFVHQYRGDISLSCGSAGSWGIFRLEPLRSGFQAGHVVFNFNMGYQHAELYRYRSHDHNTIAPINHEWGVATAGIYPPPRLAVGSTL